MILEVCYNEGVQQSLREALSGYYYLRQTGYPADAIELVYNKDVATVSIVWDCYGQPLNIHVGFEVIDFESFAGDFLNAVVAIEAGTLLGWKHNYHASEIYRKRHIFAEGYTKKGLPRVGPLLLC